MQKLLLILEHNGEDLTEAPWRLCVNTIRSVGQATEEINAVIFGSCREEALKSLGSLGIKKVYLAPGSNEEFYSPEQRLIKVLELITAEKPSLILLPNTLQGREIAPLLALKLEGGFVFDCVQLKLEEQITEVVLNIYSGQYQRVCELTGRCNVILMADVQCGHFNGSTREAEVITLAVTEKTGEPALKLLETFSLPATELDIGEADVVVGVGRGVETQEDWELMQKLALTVKAPIGGTRPAVDSGWIPFVKQIGQTGRIIAPELYIAAGISGAQQHISGVEKAKIVAINNDPQAPILRLADLGVVGDFKEIVPILTHKLQEIGKEGKE